MAKYILFLIAAMASCNGIAKSTIEFVGALEEDPYQITLLRKVLDSTIPTHGLYTLKLRPQASDLREVKLVEENPQKLRISITPKVYEHIHNPNISLVTIPIARGILGYRVCYTTKNKSKALEERFEKGQLQEIRFGSGYKWSDSDIMRFNGLNVVESGWDLNPTSAIESLYKMTSHGRVHAFCRGVNEVVREKAFIESLSNLTLNRTHVLYYNMPFFFFVNAKNESLHQRITLGLNILLEEGEFEKLWNQFHLENIKKVGLSERKVIKLKTQNEFYDTEEYRKFLFSNIETAPKQE